MTKHSKYCKNCDKWLDNENDYNKETTMMFEIIWCKSCGDKDGSIYPFICGTCKKPVDSEENLNKAKPNYKKRVLVAHDYEEGTSNIEVFKHDCFVKCKNNYAGKSCGKEWKLTKENYPLLKVTSDDSSCIDCEIEFYERRIANNEPYNEEHYEQLKKFAGKNDNPNDRERERERERAKLLVYEVRYRH